MITKEFTKKNMFFKFSNKSSRYGSARWGWKKVPAFLYQYISLIQGKLVPHFSNDFVTKF